MDNKKRSNEKFISELKNSKKELDTELKNSKDIISKLEDKLKRQQKIIDVSIFNEQFLSQTAQELVELTINDDIYDFIANKLHELIENSIIVVSLYDTSSDSFTVRSIVGEYTQLNEYSKKLFKTDILNLKVPITSFNQTYNEETQNKILKGKLQLVDKGLYQIMCGRLSQEMANQAEKVLDIGDIYGTGFHWRDQFYGAVNIFLKKGATLNNKRLVQALIRLFSVALQRRKAEKEFIETEKTYRNLLRESFDAWIIHSQGVLIDANPEAVHILGAESMEEFIGKPILDFVHPDYREIAKKRSNKLYTQGGTVPVMDEKFLKMDGTPVPVLVVATSLKYKGKNAVQAVFRDMTDRDNLMRSLQQISEELKRIFQSSPAAIIVCDLEGYVTSWSPAAKKIFGWTQEEVLGKINPTVPKQYHSLFYEQINKLEKGITFPIMEVNPETKDGTLLTMSLSLSPLYGIDGKVEGALAIMTDITEQKQAQIRLKESEIRYRTIFENTGAATILFNTEGLVTLANSEMSKLMGYKKEEIEGQKKWMNFVHPDDLPMMLEYNQKRNIDPLSVPNIYETRIIDSGGKIHYVRITVDKIPGMDEYVSSVVDITYLKNAYHELEESENRFRSLFENNPVPYQSLNQDGEYVELNEPLCHLLGYEKEELMGRSFENFLSPETRSGFTKRFNNLIDKGYVNNEELELLNKEGSKKTVILTGRVQRDPKTCEFIRTHCILNDISERKHMENQLKKSLDDKEMLLKEIHHRVKNNLMIISSLLNLQSVSIKDEKARGVFKESQNRARSMALIHDRLYRSTDLKRINFGDYIRNLTNELYHTYVLDIQRVKLVLNVEDVMIDINSAVPLGLIVNELVANAMKYAYPEGESGKIQICFHKDDDLYILRVKDDGVGIPKDLDISKVKTLGLQLVTNLTQQIDGEMELNREHGTDFEITFEESKFSK